MMADFLLAGVLTRRKLIFTVWAALALLAVPGLLRLETDNSPRVYFIDGSPALLDYERLVAAFGDSEQVRLAVSGDRLWTSEGLAWLAELERGALEAPYVTAVVGLAGHHQSLGVDWPPADPEAFRARIAGNRIDHELGLLAERDGEPSGAGAMATVLVALATPDNAAEEKTVAALSALAARAPAGLTTRLVGMPVLDRTLDASSREIGRTFFPLLVLLAIGLLAASFRDLRGVVLPLLFVAAPEVVLLGALGWLGVRLNLVLAVLPPLLFVISLATGVHLLVRFRDAIAEGAGSRKAVEETYRDKGWAVLWTGLTTMVGFGSLTISKVGPVPTLGITSAAGILLMTIAAFTLYPALLAAFGAPPGKAEKAGRAARRSGGGVRRPFEQRLQRFGRWIAEWSVEHRGLVLAVAATLMLVAALGVPRLRVESNAVEFLRPDHPVRAGIEDLEARGIGVVAAQLFLELPEAQADGGFRDIGRVTGAEALTRDLRAVPGVLGALGAGDLLAEGEALFTALPGLADSGAPDSALLFRQAVLQGLLANERTRGLFDAFVSPDGRLARVTIFLPTAGYEELEPIFRHAEAAGRRAYPDARVTLTGQYPLVLAIQRQLLVTLALSLTLTTLAIGLIFRFLLPSNRLALLALLPNLFPVAVVVGGMGWLGVPLDTATVMVASVVLGLAVDDTIHTLGHFRELAPVVGRREAVAGTLERTAPAYVLTGLILAAGFGVCALSDFAPTARFGGLSAVAILFAVLGDLFLLPALLCSTPRSAVGRLGERR